REVELEPVLVAADGPARDRLADLERRGPLDRLAEARLTGVPALALVEVVDVDVDAADDPQAQIELAVEQTRAGLWARGLDLRGVGQILDRALIPEDVGEIEITAVGRGLGLADGG